MAAPQTLIPRYFYYFHFDPDVNIRIKLSFVNPLPRPGSGASGRGDRPGQDPGDLAPAAAAVDRGIRSTSSPAAARSTSTSSRRSAPASWPSIRGPARELAAEGGRFLELNFYTTRDRVL